MSLLMGPSPNRDRANGIQHKVTSSPVRPVKVGGSKGKALNAFIQAIDSLSFDPAEFGHLLAQCELTIQRQFMRIVITYFRILSERVDSGLAPLMDDEEYDLVMNARRVHDSLRLIPMN